MSTFFSGFSLGLSLILAIGSQNAYVLKQGIKKQHVLVVCLDCAVSDALLISAGVAGFGVLVERFPQIEQIAKYLGAAFLIIYGLVSFKSAFSSHHALVAENRPETSMFKTILICLAFTWLNPHVYLDTVLLLGSISTQYQPHQFSFAIGAVTASFVFFFTLGFAARYLAPLFKSPSSWKVMEFIVGLTMFTIATSLLLN